MLTHKFFLWNPLLTSVFPLMTDPCSRLHYPSQEVFPTRWLFRSSSRDLTQRADPDTHAQSPDRLSLTLRSEPPLADQRSEKTWRCYRTRQCRDAWRRRETEDWRSGPIYCCAICCILFPWWGYRIGLFWFWLLVASKPTIQYLYVCRLFIG